MGTLRTEVRITELGSRLHFSIHLPEKFRVMIGDDMLDLTVECLNSVDRSRAFRVGMGWIRLVCGNGLFVGRVTASMRHPHVESLRVEDVPGSIAKGFDAVQVDSAHWQDRAQLKISPPVLDAWVDDVVTKKWGVLSAARTVHIARTGSDARFADPKEKVPASHRTVLNTARVPGSEPPNDNVFRVGQVLAWIANSPSEWGSRLERRRHVPELLAPLVRAAGRSSHRLSLAALVGVSILASGCALNATMVPVEGPLSQSRPVPVLNVRVDGILGNSGNLTFTMPDGDACKGRWSSAAGAGVALTTGSLISQYGSTHLSGFTIATGSGQNPGQALATCGRGRVVQVEFVTGAGTAHGFGIAKDNDGNIYRFVF